MSWLRTATALIGFGLAIVQFFERLQQAPQAYSAYLIGILLIFIGVFAIIAVLVRLG
jgi:putative membrane protein